MLPFSEPFWERFCSLFGGPKFPFFFQKLAKSENPKISEMQKNFLYNSDWAFRLDETLTFVFSIGKYSIFKGPQNGPKMVPKQSQNGPKMVPKQFTYSLLTPYLLITLLRSTT